MKVLLDTHIWLWMLSGEHRLSEPMLDVLDDRETVLYISTISYWEIAMLVERGKFDLGGDIRSWIDYAHYEIPVTELSIDRSVALTSRELVMDHRDPVDRFLVATALIHDLELATRDAVLIEAPEVPTIAA